jgi:L-2,4-diaminobutyric acid acetyltransferase
MLQIHQDRRACDDDEIVLRKPDPSSGSDVLALVQDCAPLDENSLYFYLVQCEQFRDTCVLAELRGEVVGWLSAHIPPGDPDTVFVWQVAVSEKARGLGLGLRLLDELAHRPECADVTKLQTTITEDNEASWALFRRFADRSNAEIDDTPHYLERRHFDGQHDTEHMLTLSFPEAFRSAA